MPQTPSNPKKSPKRIGWSIKKDAINPADYRRYKLPMACEDCSHFRASNETCTLGMPTEQHLRRNQELSYSLSGKVALCRLQEID
ncbi:MAG: hypothetical protein K0R29_348 [Pseudobdellovibrio sp.]|jgi:hypothetical protein|nr:hypothetical protein [Pseudobdellovibrio sp.]